MKGYRGQKNILRKLKIHPVSTIDEVFNIALVEKPKPVTGAVKAKASLADVAGKDVRPRCHESLGS